MNSVELTFLSIVYFLNRSDCRTSTVGNKGEHMSGLLSKTHCKGLVSKVLLTNLRNNDFALDSKPFKT